MENFLITSAGKRVSLTREFMHELKSVFPQAKIFTVDMNPEMAPACIISDGCFAVPRCTSADYTEALMAICKENQVRIIIPTIDTELAILANKKDMFYEQGIQVLVPDENFITICRDKRKTIEFFRQHDIKVPESRDKYHPKFPMFAKPYDGSRSIDIHVFHKCEELTDDIKTDPKLIFMEYIDTSDYKEYSVDMYYGRDNHVKSIVPRERIEIRAGEINKGITRKNYLVDYLRQRLECMPGVVGCICIQVFYREADNDVIGIEINPRFAGGYPLSYCAGANFPLMIINEYMFGENIDYSENWRDSTIMLRYDDEVIVYK